MIYDRVDWHNGGDFPSELPPENGGTHIGMFLCWAISRHLESQFHKQESFESLAAVRTKMMTGRDFLFSQCDGKFWIEDLSDEGNAFAMTYYKTDEYIDDYEKILGNEVVTLYHIQDSWENFDQLIKASMT